jgi:hypothetical protein
MGSEDLDLGHGGVTTLSPPWSDEERVSAVGPGVSNMREAAAAVAAMPLPPHLEGYQIKQEEGGVLGFEEVQRYMVVAAMEYTRRKRERKEAEAAARAARRAARTDSKLGTAGSGRWVTEALKVTAPGGWGARCVPANSLSTQHVAHDGLKVSF